ncbi:isopeptide-forming domain-containing fimbrial protein [Streptomyces sp. NPDC007861]|uniref:DUF7927 domain-containing protein n=1 Tax=Streptomyces sp. NPDC007861 TaxID=3154893 RepID=UPI0033C0076B
MTIGGTVPGCPDTPGDTAAPCAGGAAGRGGAGQVVLPPGAQVAYARLFWGGNDGTYRDRDPESSVLQRCAATGADDVTRSPGAPLAAVPAIGVNGAAPTAVDAENLVRDQESATGPHYYTGEADVTDAFDGVTGTGSPVPVAVGGVWTAAGRGCVAGWSLTVVYAYDGPDATYAPERRHVSVHGGHVLRRPPSATSTTAVPVGGFQRAGGKVRTSVTAFRGDRENLSVDDEEFDLPKSALGSVPYTVEPGRGRNGTTGGTYLASALAVSAPVADLEISKAASQTWVKPGDTVTYTITAKNAGASDLPEVRFTDDLSENLDDAVYDDNARASAGRVAYEEPRLTYSGALAAGESVTVTYSVTIDEEGTGDGRLRNTVVADTARSNCEEGSEDGPCAVTPEVGRRADAASGEGTAATEWDTGAGPGIGAVQGRPALPAPGPGGMPADRSAPAVGPTYGSTGQLAATGASAEQLWLLGGVAVALTAAGAIALAATRGRRRGHH